MLQTFQTIYEGARLTRTPQKIRQIAAIDGAIESITIEANNVTLGDYVFNVKKNGVALFSGINRITINPANKIVTKTGLNIAVALGDLISFHLEEAGQTGLLPEIYFIVEIDDGVDAETDIAADVHAATAKTTPVDNDEFALVDSAASNVLKKLSWQNLKATLKTYFDTLYQAVLVSGTNIKTINSQSLLGSGNISISGGGGSSSEGFALDNEPDGVNSQSDWFRETTLDSKWSDFQTAFATRTVNRNSVKFEMPSQSGDKNNGIFEPLPSGDCTIIVKLYHNIKNASNFTSAGIALFQDATNNPNTTDLVNLRILFSGGNVEISKFDDYQSYNSLITNVGSGVVSPIGIIYLRMSRSGTNWVCSYSFNGYVWVDSSPIAQSSFGFVPAEMGVVVNNLSHGFTNVFRFSAFRYFNYANATLFD